MKIKIKQYMLMSIIILSVFLALGSVCAQGTSNDTLITSDSSYDEGFDEDNTDYNLIKESQDDSVNTDDNYILSSDDKTVKTESKYSTLYANSQGLSSNTGEDSSNPTTLSNAISNIADNGTIILTAADGFDVYNLTSHIYLSSSNNLKTLSINAQQGFNITISGDYTTHLFNIYRLNITFSNINFVKSNSSSNTALYLSYSNVTFNNCSFADNYRQNYSSTIYASYSTVNINNSIFTNNTAGYGGVIYQSYSTLNIYSSNFTDNSAFSGGCIYSINSKASIYDAVFKYNNASFGGCIFNLKSNMTVSSSLFEDNYADYYGGAIIHLNPTKLTVNNSQFISNNAEYGAAVYVMYANVNISKTVFKSNTAVMGSGIYSYNNTIKVKNSIITDDNSSIVYLRNVNSYDINENWWGVNNPDFNTITSGVIPDNWVLMTFRNTTSMASQSYNILVSLNTLSNSSNLKTTLPQATVSFTADSGVFDKTIANITGELSNTYTGNSIIYASIDNQQMKVNAKIMPLLFADNVTAKKASTVNVTIYQNNDITGTIHLTVNNQTRTLTAKKTVSTAVTLNNNHTGTIPVYIEYSGDNKYESTNYTTYITVIPSEYTMNDTITRLYNKNQTSIILPSSYSLVDEGQVTEIKSQGNAGSCVSFAVIGAVESSVLKATNISMDLSENNVKNMFKLYSILGLQYLEPNDGGYDFEAIGYMASGFGPVYEQLDQYSTMSHISNIFNPNLQIQNIYIVPSRQNFTDNDLIKEAVMKYGAVYTGIKSSSSLNIYNYNTYEATHAVSIVGWDDNYSASNFQTTPPGDGAFIIRNSWGTNTGINGYQYVSYYDVVIGNYAYLGDYTSVNFAVDYNNNYNYTGIYQYDTVCYVYSISQTGGQYWIKNKYIMDKNESIAAIGSYFMDTTGYQLELYINDNLVTTINATVDYPGYRTIELDNLYRVSENDEVTVILNIKQSLNDSKLYIPLQDNDYPIEVTEAVTYISYDGSEYTDLYYYGDEGKYAAPIKLYMQNIPEITSDYRISSDNILINTTTSQRLDNARVYYRINGEDITDGEGNLIVYNITNDTTVTSQIDISQLEEGNHTYDVTVEYDGYNITKTFNFTVISITVEAENTTAVVNTPLNVTVKVYDNENNLINDGLVVFRDDKNRTIQQANITDGRVSLNATFTTTYNSLIYVNFIDEHYNLYDAFTLNVCKIDTQINIVHNQFIASQKVNITAIITDENGNSITGGKIVFKINGKTIKDANGKIVYVKVSCGTATLEYDVPNSYANKNITIDAVYSGSSLYNSQRNSTNTTIHEKVLEPVVFTNDTYTAKVNQTIEVTVKVNNTFNAKIVFKINGKTVKDERGKVIYLSVYDNQATLNYTIPTSYKSKTYTLTAVCISNNQRIETDTTLTITG